MITDSKLVKLIFIIGNLITNPNQLSEMDACRSNVRNETGKSGMMVNRPRRGRSQV